MTLPISNYRFAILSGDEPRSSEDRQVAVLNGPFTISERRRGAYQSAENWEKRTASPPNRQSKIENVVAR